MAFIYDNPNPCHERVGDCVVRAISIATGKTWGEVYLDLCVYGYRNCDMPSSNAVWGQYLNDLGFERYPVNPCTIAEFSSKNRGVCVLGTGTHVVCLKGGDYYDTWDSGDEAPIYEWRKK